MTKCQNTLQPRQKAFFHLFADALGAVWHLSHAILIMFIFRVQFGTSVRSPCCPYRFGVLTGGYGLLYRTLRRPKSPEVPKCTPITSLTHIFNDQVPKYTPTPPKSLFSPVCRCFRCSLALEPCNFDNVHHFECSLAPRSISLLPIWRPNRTIWTLYNNLDRWYPLCHARPAATQAQLRSP
jgi:hypothetical protein